jgi:hypothetical protein
MTPFSHSAALSGAPVTTRSGKEVKQLTWFESARGWTGVIDGEIESWHSDGSYYDSGGKSNYDLFMSDLHAPAVQKYDRAEIAKCMMAAIVSVMTVGTYSDCAMQAVKATDALINELNKEKQ